MREVALGKTEADTMAVTQDNRLFILGCANGIVQIWDFRKGKRIAARCAHMDGYVSNLTLSGNDRLLASCGTEGTIVIWDLQKSIK